MSRRFPLCAWCGLRLVDDPHVRLTFSRHGDPEIGWHSMSRNPDCDDQDPIFQRHNENRRAGGPDISDETLAVIIERGRDRVSAGAAFWRGRS